MKVLIVDDDPVTRSLLKAFLHKWGYEVVIARGGTEAWEILQEPESPSLVNVRLQEKVLESPKFTIGRFIASQVKFTILP